MSQMARATRLAPVVVFACLVSLSAAADLAPWDQARVTGIAKQLANACDAFDQAVRQQPGMGDLGAGQAEMGLSLGGRAQALREQSQALADHLEKGKGHDPTRNEWRSLREIADDVEERAQRHELDDPTLAAWARVADLMRQLAPYYAP